MRKRKRKKVKTYFDKIIEKNYIKWGNEPLKFDFHTQILHLCGIFLFLKLEREEKEKRREKREERREKREKRKVRKFIMTMIIIITIIIISINFMKKFTNIYIYKYFIYKNH